MACFNENNFISVVLENLTPFFPANQIGTNVHYDYEYDKGFVLKYTTAVAGGSSTVYLKCVKTCDFYTPINYKFFLATSDSNITSTDQRLTIYKPNIEIHTSVGGDIIHAFIDTSVNDLDERAKKYIEAVYKSIIDSDKFNKDPKMTTSSGNQPTKHHTTISRKVRKFDLNYYETGKLYLLNLYSDDIARNVGLLVEATTEKLTFEMCRTSSKVHYNANNQNDVEMSRIRKLTPDASDELRICEDEEVGFDKAYFKLCDLYKISYYDNDKGHIVSYYYNLDSCINKNKRIYELHFSANNVDHLRINIDEYLNNKYTIIHMQEDI